MKRLSALLSLAPFLFLVGCISSNDDPVACTTDADCTGEMRCIGGFCAHGEDGDGDIVVDDGDETADGDANADGDLNEDAPEAVIEIPVDQQDPEPLDVIHLDGRASTSPLDDACKPFEYWWEWSPGGKPPHAQDAILIPSTGTFDNPQNIMDKWTSEGYPKIYFPIAGNYIIRLKVRDACGNESGPTPSNPDQPEWAEIDIKVRPSQMIHAELLWDRGDDLDLDIFLVRFREDGTFALPHAFVDRMEPTSTTMPRCNDASDCWDGAFECIGTYCKNYCETDEDCEIGIGWQCNTTSNECETHPQRIIECETDADCGAGFCNPAKIGISSYMICTRHEGLAVNDTCSHINKMPMWGGYSPLAVGCQGNDECNGTSESGPFTCNQTCDCSAYPDGSDAYNNCMQNDQCCNFACQNSGECLSVSDQYICDSELGACVGNSLNDDPTLDIDDVNGWGPENISLREPQSGRYRIIVRFYADPQDVASLDAGPSGPVKAYVKIYLNGEMALQKDFGHELALEYTYWKVADIIWDANVETTDGDKGVGSVEPICAGWTLTECDSSDQCTDWFGDSFDCDTRDQGKWCSTCANGEGTAAECNPTATSCESDDDCAGEPSARTCTTITGNYCTCKGSNPFANFSDDPYANPYVTVGWGIMDPKGDFPRSLWCDSASDSTKSIPSTEPGGEPATTDVPILGESLTCGGLYSR